MARSALLKYLSPFEIDNLQVCEGKIKYSETEIQNLWEKFLSKERFFRSIGGAKIKVLFPGERNLFGGPDFKNAVVEIDGAQFRGDVEIHKDVEDWYKHGHHKDTNYDRVVLHVVLKNERELKVVKTSQGVRVETVVVGDFTDILKFAQIDEKYTSTKAPPCISHLCFDFPSVIRMLSQERLLGRIEKFRSRTKLVSLDQALYEQIFWGLGAGTRLADVYLNLAKRITYPYAREISIKDISLLESVYLNELGHILDGVDDRISDLSFINARITEKNFFETLCDENRSLPNVRVYSNSAYPASLPPNRVVFMSSLIGALKASLVETVLDFFKISLDFPKPWLKWKEFFHSITNMCESGCSNMKLRNTGKKSKVPIGEQKILTILGNVIIPFAFYCYFEGILGIDEDRLWELYFALPGESENWILRKMKNIRGLVFSDKALKFFEQQGLIQWYRNSCANHPDCYGCPWNSCYRLPL